MRSQLGRLDRRFTHDPDWTLGLLGGRSPLDLSPVAGIDNPIVAAPDLPGRRSGFVADPFAVRVDGRWYLFYEVMDLWSRRGVIAVSSSDDLRHWSHHGTVLREAFHLSYPHVFRAGDDIYMTPEAWESGSVRLYRATSFPTGWVHEADLLRGPVLLDPTPFAHEGRWYLFADTSPTATAGDLRLFSASGLRGPWTQHPASPVRAADAAMSRPGGRTVVWQGGAYRLAQDCSRRYGDALNLLRIDVLDDRRYRESVVAAPLLGGSGTGWNATSMHHADMHVSGDDGWLAFVDGHASP